MSTDVKKPYRLIFEAPAVVQFEVVVNAENQQTALIDGHDMLVNLSPSSAKVVSIAIPSAELISLEVSDATSAKELATEEGSYTIQFFHGPSTDSFAYAIKASTEQQAETRAREILNEDLKYFQAKIFDSNMQAVLKLVTKRSGYEVQYTKKGGTEDLYVSNYPSLNAALQAIPALHANHDGDAYVVVKYNDANRKVPPTKITTVKP